jgi:hypothetical protein
VLKSWPDLGPQLLTRRGWQGTDLQGTYLRLYTNPTGAVTQAFAIFDAEVEGNWMSARILMRMKPPPKSRQDSIVREAYHNAQHLKSTGSFVDLIYGVEHEGGNQQYRLRFYIVEHPKFDVLFGLETPAARKGGSVQK